ncbi:hypothetical protein Bca101_020552 [Brassica carinata]
MLLGLCRKRMLLEARVLLNSLISTGCTVDITLYNIVIDGYAKSGYIEEALGLFRGVMESGVAPNVATFNSLIYGYCKTQNIAEARKVLDAIKSYGLVQNFINLFINHLRFNLIVYKG